MNLDTVRLRARIQDKMARAQRRMAEIQEEMSALEQQKPRLQSALNILESVEKLAAEFDNPTEADRSKAEHPLESVRDSVESAWERLRRPVDPVAAVQPKEEAVVEPAVPKEAPQPAKYSGDRKPSDNDPYFAQWG